MKEFGIEAASDKTVLRARGGTNEFFQHVIAEEGDTIEVLRLPHGTLLFLINLNETGADQLDARGGLVRKHIIPESGRQATISAMGATVVATMIRE